MAFLELDRIGKRYGEQVALHELSVAVEQGEFVALLGPSGCGKTTTLQMIAGFVLLSQGAIRLDGKDLARVRPAKRGLGVVFQSYALFPHMSVTANIGFGLEIAGVGRAERAKRVEEMLALVGLGGMADRLPRRMSGGQQQRVALARALAIRPRVLLLDEPLSNLDAKLREEMQMELRQIQRTLGTTTVLVTHDQAEAMALSDRIVVMRSGRVEQIGTPQEVYERPASTFVAGFLGRTNEFAATVADGMVSAGGVSYWSAAPGPPGPALVTVRPEKITFAERGLPAQVRARIFQGNHYLFQLETTCGAAIVMCPNDGGALPGEGERVHLNWRDDDMILRPVAA